MSQTGSNPAPGGSNAGGRNYRPKKFYLGSSLDHGSGVGDWRKGSADIKLLLKNLYSQSPMPHTDVTFKVICIIGNGIIIHCNITVKIGLTKTQLHQSLFMRKKIF